MKNWFKKSIQAVVLLGITACFFSCDKEKEAPSQETFIAVGEINGLKEIVDSFMVNVSLDTAILPPFVNQGIFVNTNLTLNYRNNLVDFLCEHLNGPCIYKAGIIFNLSDSVKAVSAIHMEQSLTQNSITGGAKDSVLSEFTDYLSYQSVVE